MVGVDEEIVAPLDLVAIAAVEDDAVGDGERVGPIDIVAIVVAVRERDGRLPQTVEEQGAGRDAGEVLLRRLERVRVLRAWIEIGLGLDVARGQRDLAIRQRSVVEPQRTGQVLVRIILGRGAAAQARGRYRFARRRMGCGGRRERQPTGLAPEPGASTDRLVRSALEPPRDIRSAPTGRRHHIDNAGDRVGTIERALRTPQHLDPVEASAQQVGIVEGAVRRAGIAHFDPVDQHQGVVGVGATREHGCHPPRTAELRRPQSGNAAQCLWHQAMTPRLHTLGGDHGNRAPDLADRGRQPGCCYHHLGGERRFGGLGGLGGLGDGGPGERANNGRDDEHPAGAGTVSKHGRLPPLVGNERPAVAHLANRCAIVRHGRTRVESTAEYSVFITPNSRNSRPRSRRHHYGSPHRKHTPSAGWVIALRRQVSWLAVQRSAPCLPSFPVAFAGAELTAYSCGGSPGIGPVVGGTPSLPCRRP